MVARASHCGRRHNQSQTVSRELRSTAMLPRMIPEPAVAIHVKPLKSYKAKFKKVI